MFVNLICIKRKHKRWPQEGWVKTSFTKLKFEDDDFEEKEYKTGFAYVCFSQNLSQIPISQ
jgi:hypothetical protein